MYIKQVPNDKPQNEIGQAGAIVSPVKTIPDQPLDDYCLCDLGAVVCEYEETAFFGGSNEYQNDYVSFFVNKVDDSDTIVFVLIDKKDDSETILDSSNADQYGLFSDDSNHSGIRVDFDTLKTNFPDLKRVSFRIDQTVFGSLVSRTSHVYRLTQYDDLRADGTVRIETINSGRIESGNDYDSLKWKRSLRIRGFFGNKTPSLESDNYLDGERVIKQIQDKIVNEYTLETELIPSVVFNLLIYNDMLSNEIFVSDYNIKNAENYKGLRVVPDAISSRYFEKNQNGSFEITFKDRVENIVKRNV